MSSGTETFVALLKQHRQSVTKARLAVFHALLGQEPMSMHQLVSLAQGIDRASVYRAVELFERLGIVQRIHTGWKYKLELSDSFAEHHHHLTCSQCGQTITMNEHQLERLVEKLAASHGFWSTAHQIEIQGVCSDCRSSRQVQAHS